MQTDRTTVSLFYGLVLLCKENTICVVVCMPIVKASCIYTVYNLKYQYECTVCYLRAV